MSNAACTCQYGNTWHEGGRDFTPYWYISVKRCALHSHLYDPSQAPPGVTADSPYREFAEVARDREASR